MGRAWPARTKLSSWFQRPRSASTAPSTQSAGWAVQKTSAAGVGAYLVKPPRAAELGRAIEIARARFQDMLELRQLNTALESRNRDLREALANVKTLRGLLPICGSCKKIRDDTDSWHRLETYIEQHSEAMFTHSLCGDCREEHFPRREEKEEPEPTSA